MKTFSILGTGWLGYALAKKLKKDFLVKVSIRNKEKEKEFIEEGLFPSLFNEKSFDALDNLLDTDYLFINFPPSKFENYILFLEKIYFHPKIYSIKKIFFISSTSVYPNENINLVENLEIEKPVSQIVFDAEEIAKDSTNIIFRCAGLMGYNRIAGKYFSGKVLDSANVKVNYVHRDDVIDAVSYSIENDLSGIFNLCAPFHPTRKEVYLKNAKKYTFDKPIFKNEKEYKNRIVDGSKIEKLGFRYKYPNPLEF